MRRIVPLALAGLVVGAALGLLVGWRLWPVEYTNTFPAQLRQDYRNDYVLMVAAAYSVEQDLEAARSRLALLDAEAPVDPLIELAEELIAAAGPHEDITLLANLADAMGAATPAMVRYLEDAG